MKHLCSALVQLAIIMSATIAPAAPPPLTATLTEQWRLTESDDSPLIGDIVDAATDTAGNTYLMDFKLQTVLVIDPKGAFLRTIGGPGDGPGETRMPSRVFVEPDGRVGLLDAMSSRLVWCDAAGQPASGGHLRLNADGSGTLVTYDARRIAGGYVAAFMVADPSKQTRAVETVLARVPDDGTASAILYRAPDTAASLVGPATNEAELYNFVWRAWGVSRAGNVYLAPDRDRPRILMLPAGGGEPVEIKLVTGRRNRTAAEKADTASRFARQGSGAGREVADADPFVAYLWCDELGRVCVYTPSPEPPLGAGVFVAYDVYSEAGAYLQRVELRGPDDARFDNWFVLPGKRVVVVRNVRDGGSGEGPEVVGYSF
ncbi:MAG: hypothetical protein IPH48_07230 [bacterium]|nr:hypothetical protein [bacterium]